MQPHISYLICCMPRTGSWLLSEALQRTGVAGRPREYFAPERQQNFADSWGMSIESGWTEYLNRVIKEGTTSNGVFAAKVHWYQFKYLMQRLNDPSSHQKAMPSLMSEVFPGLHYIYLTRRDKVRHAVSYAKATYTQLWWEIDSPDGLGRRVLARTPQFDAARIDRLFEVIVRHERSWRQYFRQCGATPFKICYEDLVQDYEGAACRILEYLQVPIPAGTKFERSRLRKQADDLSEEWVRQYRKILRARVSGECESV
jgi:trehalose 2-sulfotransferase